MCTLVVAAQVWRGLPLVVAANRDEQLGRPAMGPRVQTQAGVRFLAPRDLEAGGTWLAINDSAVLVAITNRFTGPPTPVEGSASFRSRGLLVLDALLYGTAEQAAAQIESVDPERHRPFHLVLADQHGAHLVWNDGRRHRHERLKPGFHIITERSLDAAPTERPQRLQTALRPLFRPKPPDPAAWTDILSLHSEPPLESICVHAPDLQYGTRSSTLVQLGADPTHSHYLHADGPPCQTSYRDLSTELREMLD